MIRLTKKYFASWINLFSSVH